MRVRFEPGETGRARRLISQGAPTLERSEEVWAWGFSQARVRFWARRVECRIERPVVRKSRADE